jgi:hypothetical protein
MKVLKLREKLGKLGLLLLEHGDNWMVTNNGTAKTLFEKEFSTLDDVQMWLENPARRLTEKEAELFDDDFAEFAKGEI